MSILDSELKLLKSLVVDDTASNGGKMDNNASITSGVANNLWPNVFKAERTSGSTKYRKCFLKIANDDDYVLYNPQLWLDVVTPGDDWVTMFPATQSNTQGDVTGSEYHYGCAPLLSNVSAAASTFTVDVEDVSLVTGGADEIFRDGDVIRITDKVLPSSVSGNEEFHTINGTPTVSGTEVTITILNSLTNSYLVSAGARVMSIYEPSDIEVNISGWSETVAGDGTYDESTTGNVVADAIGSIYETYTLTFTDATSFTCTDADLNVISSGTTSVDYSPTNSDVSKPFFTILAAGWSGTWASGDTITFTTNPASVPMFQKRVVPAGAGSLAGNKTNLVATGESA